MTKNENIAMMILRSFFDYTADENIEIRESADFEKFYQDTQVGKKLAEELLKFLKFSQDYEEYIFDICIKHLDDLETITRS